MESKRTIYITTRVDVIVANNNKTPDLIEFINECDYQIASNDNNVRITDTELTDIIVLT